MSTSVLSFNPRARVGRDTVCGNIKSIVKVSIHAPAWGATQYLPRITVDRIVSIHAPAWGATLSVITGVKLVHGFNPRARVGRDLTGYQRIAGYGGFNPRARVGRDEFADICKDKQIKFQSTRPRGARRLKPRVTSRVAGFQSTRPRGARPEALAAMSMNLLVSIHAPAWGATPVHGNTGRSQNCFNPRARVGRDASP